MKTPDHRLTSTKEETQLKIYREGDHVRLQLKDNTTNKMLFNFYVHKDAYEELWKHMTTHLATRTPEVVLEGYIDLPEFTSPEDRT